MVTIDIHSRRDGYYENRLLSAISDLNGTWPADTPTAADAKIAIENALKEVPRRSTQYASDCYKLELSPNWQTLTIYHLDLYGTADRKIATITTKR